MSTDDYGNIVYPGSLDNGATDAEYTPRPERLICASDEHYATHAELDAAIADTCTVIDELEARIVALETKMAWAHEQLRAQLLVPLEPLGRSTAEYLRGFADGEAAMRKVQSSQAHIPIAEWLDICAELQELRVQNATLKAQMQEPQP